MSTNDPSIEATRQDGLRINTKELTELLIKHYDLHEGKYELMLQFQIGVGMYGPTQETQCPGASLAISHVGVMPARSESSPTAVDAALVNPPKKQKQRK